MREDTVSNSSLCCEEVPNSFTKFNMQSLVLLCFAALVACAYAEVVLLLPTNSEFKPRPQIIFRRPRDVTWERNAGSGKVFGTLGSTDDSLFGRGGYKQDIFNNHRGHLQGQAYGSRVLGANGDSSILGGRLDWSNDNARAALDIQKNIGRGSSATLTGDGVWKLDKNTRFVAGGNVHKNFGHDKPELGIQGKIEHDF